MVTQFDEKGNFFSDVIQKEPVAVTIQLAGSRVHGSIHIRNESRLKEELDDPTPFLAVTHADVYNTDGLTHLFSTRFVAINKAQIIWITSDKDISFKEVDQ